jgi:phosphatidylglycerophosphatase A
MNRWAKSSITGKATGNPPNRFAQILTYIFGTGFGTGLLPYAQGTAGSLLWLPIWLLLVPDNIFWEVGVALAINLISIPLSGWGERMWGEDPGRITVDEFAGQAIALIAVPRTPLFIIAAFIFFRLFDTFKPKWVKNHVESLHGGLGVTLDDTVAGILARLCMVPLIYFL